MTDVTKLKALLDWMYQTVGDNLLAIIVVDREGLVMESLLKKGIDEEMIGGLAALVEPVLNRIKADFVTGSFGTGAFDTNKYRLIFCEAGPNAILVVALDLMTSIDAMFPYAYLCAEKAARIFDGRPVSPVIPILMNPSNPIESQGEITRILIEEGSYILKTIICGDGGVGKTTLVTQFVTGQFEEDYKKTIGLSIMKKAINFKEWKVEVRMTIFDLAGQDQFARVRQTYYKGAMAGFIVFDVTRRETFDTIRHWHNEATQINPEIMMMLVGNKIDLEEARLVKKEEARALADELKMPYFETSALDQDLVNEAFRSIAFLFIQPYVKGQKIK